jgi:hypothetical protein
METLISTLLSFLVPIVIVVTIVVRVYGVIKGLKDSKNNPLQATGPSIRPPEPKDEDDWKPPELDDDDDVPTAVTAPRPVTRKPPAPAYKAPAPVSYAYGSSAYDLPPVPLEPEQAAPAAPPEFFRRLEVKPLMQQAVILAEVLGLPKGME